MCCILVLEPVLFFNIRILFYWRVLWERFEKEVIFITWAIKLQSISQSIWTTRKLNLQKNFLNNLRQFYSLGHNRDVFMDVEEVGYGMWLKILTAGTPSSENFPQITPYCRRVRWVIFYIPFQAFCISKSKMISQTRHKWSRSISATFLISSNLGLWRPL